MPNALHDFHQLERHRVRDILLVSSLFDFYLFEEEGLLYEQIQSEYYGKQLSHAPELTRVSSGAEALKTLKENPRFDLVITTLHIEDMTPLRLARGLRESGIATPIVLLAHDKRELAETVHHADASAFHRVFIWQGDFRLLIAIIKSLEDELNVAHDTSLGVQCILLNEDSTRYASFFLPLLYSEVMKHSQDLLAEGLNPAHRALRMRARPKILYSSNWEEAMRCLERYQENVIGVITDAGFRRDGEHDPRAGIAFTKEVKARFWDVPVLIQSSDPGLAREAEEAKAMFVAKSSPTLAADVRHALREYFGFGDFVFRKNGKEIERATDLRSLEDVLATIDADSLKHHAERNDFSNWLKARTEFELAKSLRPQKVSDYASVDELRRYLITQLKEHRTRRQRGLLSVFSPGTFDPASSFARMGAGSVGGKARGLAFLNTLLSMENLRRQFPDLEIEVPPAVVIGTDVFDEFLKGFRAAAAASQDDEEIMHRFVAAEHFPGEARARLAELLTLMRTPLAVRSSSLLEDTQFHPFAGIYQTYMIPNRDPDPAVRLRELLTAIKRVYASTFHRAASEYIKVTSLRPEDEKMAVIVQQMVGAAHGSRFYPEISGVARSYNFYPAGPQKPEDGIVAVALGLGKTIVEGGAAVRFSPKYPDHLQQFFSARDALRDTQRTFYALDLAGAHEITSIADERIVPFELRAAEEDGTLHWAASTYSAENDALYDGLSRAGTRVVTFAPILRHRLLPLAKALESLCRLGAKSIGTPVEIEFAADLSKVPARLGLLQMRPLVLSQEMEELDIDGIPAEQLVCQSNQVLGHGAIRDLCDVVVVDVATFERSRSAEAARAVAKFNERLVDERRHYLLIGPGRWGSLDPLLGIPVKWDQICGARAIVEAGFRDLSIDPSQGSHFFQNLTAFQVGYFSVNPRVRNSFVDWDWLATRSALEAGPLVRHIRLDRGLTVKMNGRERRGVILKPA